MKHIQNILLIVPAGKILLILKVSVLLFLSCGIFEPRTPDEPEAARGAFKPPTSVDIVIENFVNAISERNSQHYVQNFVDTSLSDYRYEFQPTQEAIATYGNIFAQWSTREERSYFENLISRTPANNQFQLTLSNPVFESIQSDLALFRANYTLVAEHNDEGFQYTSFQGTLRFSLSTDNNNHWVIHRWEDLKFNDEHNSWSMLKGKFVN